MRYVFVNTMPPTIWEWFIDENHSEVNRSVYLSSSISLQRFKSIAHILFKNVLLTSSFRRAITREQ